MEAPPELLDPPDATEVAGIARGVATAVAVEGRLTDLQRALVEAVVHSMTGHTVDLAAFEPMDATALGAHLSRRSLAFRDRIVQIMLLGALILRPLPEDVIARVCEAAAALGVDDGMIAVARRFADGALGLAGIDFQRNGYTADWHPEDAAYLHTSRQLADAWDTAVCDDLLASRWRALEHLPPGTLGRRVTEMYRARGFSYPGTSGSAPPLLAQHDWVHVLAGYGTTVDNELEVFAFIARANDDPRGFSLLAMVVSLFETGYLRSAAGLFEYDIGHLSANRGVAVRVADAMRRGALTRDGRDGSPSVDFLAVDWFTLAALPVPEARALFGVLPKSAEAVAAGSVGLWEPGGISAFQDRAGRALADHLGVPYEGFGASVERTFG